MKRTLLALLLAFASLSLAFVSCDNDGDDKTDHAAAIAGKYSGQLNVFTTLIDKDIDVQRSGANKVKIVLNDFSYEEMDLGDIVVDKITVSENGGKYELKETTAAVAVSLMPGLPPANIPVTVSGTVSGNTLNLTIGINFEGTQAMNVTFEGSKN